VILRSLPQVFAFPGGHGLQRAARHSWVEEATPFIGVGVTDHAVDSARKTLES
jgi:hypothetical protein